MSALFPTKLLKNISDWVTGSFKPRTVAEFITTGKNLFDKAAIESGKYLVSGGGTTANADFFITDYIPVLAGQQIIFSAMNTSGAAGLCFYKNRVYVSFLSNSAINGAGKIITVPGNVDSFRASGNVAQTPLNTWQIEEGTASTAYEAFNQKIALPYFKDTLNVNSLTELRTTGKNLFDKSAIESGKYLVTGGGTTDNADFFITAHIPVLQGQQIIFSASNTSGAAGLCFYKNRVYVSFLSNSAINGAGKIITVPGNVDSFRASGNVTGTPVDTWQIEEGLISTTYEAYKKIIALPAFKTPLSFPNLEARINSILAMVKTNLYDSANYIQGQWLGTTGVIAADANWAWSNFVSVEANRTYTRNLVTTGGTASTRSVWYFDSSYTLLGSCNDTDGDHRALKFTTPANCAFIGINIYNAGVFDYRENYKIVKFGATASNNLLADILNTSVTAFGDLVKSTSKYLYSQVSLTKTIVAVYEQHVIYLYNGFLYYGSNGIENQYDFTALQINSTNFPTLASGAGILRVVLFDAIGNIRTLVFTTDNKAYYSNGQVFGNFALSKIWTLPGEPFKHPSISQKDPTDTRYQFHTPANIATRNHLFSWMGGNFWFRQVNGGFIFGNYADNTVSATSVPSCVYFTVDGENIYIQYMFGMRCRRVKLAGTSTYINRTAAFGDNLNTSAFTNAYSTGLTLKARTPIVPSKASLEPTNIFEFTTPTSVTGFSRANPAVATVADATGVEVGDIVCFDGDASDAEWNALRNTTAITTGATAGGNGRFYIVTVKSGLNLTLADPLGNPHNNLTARHIHSINEASNGIIIGVGEEHPEGWLIFMNSFFSPTTFSRWSSYRINSSEDGLQRTLGVYMRSDNKLLFASDSNNVWVQYDQITGRAQGWGRYSSGLWLGDYKDVDNWSKFKNKLPNVAPAYHFRRIGTALIYVSQFGETYISFDEGDTWDHVITDNSSKDNLLGFDKGRNRFYFSGQKIIELK